MADERMGAEVFEFGAENPIRDDPRFDPESDMENWLAHADPELASEKRPKSDLQDVVTRMIEEAVQFYEEELEPDQVEATRFYKGEPFGDEEEGRSKVVSTDVRDATHAQMPSLMRIFFGPERVVEYRPDRPEMQAAARQATDYVNYIVTEENPGFLTLHSAFQDALVRRLGVIKWWWDERYRTEVQRYSGLAEQQVMLLMNDPEAEVRIDRMVPDQMFGVLFDATVERTERDGCPRIAAVPPEEFGYTPSARSLEDAPLVYHSREVPSDEVRQLLRDEGLPEHEIDAILKRKQGRKRATSSDDLETARTFHGSEDADDEDSRDGSQRPVLFTEAYALVDGDEDGIAERRLFKCIGPDYEIVNNDGAGEVVDGVPFADFTPYPEAHTVVGLSNYDLLKEVQRVKSQMERGYLDSMALALEPDQEVVVGEVNMQDLLSSERGKIIRVQRPGMMRELQHGFIGPQVLDGIMYQDEKKENRTGITKAAAGLDADSLQSSTKAAVAATLSASQQRIEMIARVFAETGMKRLFQGLLKLVVKHQDRARIVRLRGEYVEVDPRNWDAEMDVTVNVALGQGMPEDRVQALAQILGIQKELLGTGSPIVSNVELRNALGRAVEMAGFRNSDEFFKPWGPEQEMQMQQQMAQQPPPPDPNMLLIEAEKAKNEMRHMIDQQKLQLEQWKAQMEDDRERDKMSRDHVIKQAEVQIDAVEAASKVEKDRKASSEIERAA